MTSGNQYLTVPTDWLANFSLAVIDSSGNYSYLLNKDVNFIREAFPNPTSTGQPTHYALFDQNSYILGPTQTQIILPNFIIFITCHLLLQAALLGWVITLILFYFMAL